jgi:hypothetical protein
MSDNIQEQIEALIKHVDINNQAGETNHPQNAIALSKLGSLYKETGKVWDIIFWFR